MALASRPFRHVALALALFAAQHALASESEGSEETSTELDAAEEIHDPSASIVGGTEVTDRSSPEFLHTVRMLFTGTLASTPDVPADMRGKSVTWRCSGTIVAPKAVVTAAHCMPSKLYLAFGGGRAGWVGLVSVKGEVFFKESSRADTAWGAPTAHLVRHPAYADDWMVKVPDAWNPTSPVNDIAVAFLRDPVPGIKAPVALTESGATLPAGVRVTLAGFGRTGGDNPYEMPVLRKVEVPYRALLRNGADAYLGEGDLVKPRTVGLPRGACGGDSGGPVYVKTSAGVALGGVIVRGPGNDNGGCNASVTIMTDVRAYVPWLRATLAAGAARGE